MGYRGLRYFAATAMGGRLFVQGLTTHSPWDASRLVYWDAGAVDKVCHPLAGDRKVESAEELLEVLRASERGLPAIKVWVQEGLEADVWRDLGEKKKRQRTNGIG